MKQLLLVACGGAAGSVLRFLASKLNVAVYLFSIPVGTLAVNVIGSFVIGLITALSLKYTGISDSLKLLLITGFCGGFTTFSAFAGENLLLFQNGQTAAAIFYILATLLLGGAAVFAGYYLIN